MQISGWIRIRSGDLDWVDMDAADFEVDLDADFRVN